MNPTAVTSRAGVIEDRSVRNKSTSGFSAFGIM
jgi:hypothetical protein